MKASWEPPTQHSLRASSLPVRPCRLRTPEPCSPMCPLGSKLVGALPGGMGTGPGRTGTALGRTRSSTREAPSSPGWDTTSLCLRFLIYKVGQHLPRGVDGLPQTGHRADARARFPVRWTVQNWKVQSPAGRTGFPPLCALNAADGSTSAPPVLRSAISWVFGAKSRGRHGWILRLAGAPRHVTPSPVSQRAPAVPGAARRTQNHLPSPEPRSHLQSPLPCTATSQVPGARTGACGGQHSASPGLLLEKAPWHESLLNAQEPASSTPRLAPVSGCRPAGAPSEAAQGTVAPGRGAL